MKGIKRVIGKFKARTAFIYVGARGEEGIATDKKSYHILPESVK